MATINGRPSIFKTPEGVTPELDYPTYFNGYVKIATEMVSETETPEADPFEMTAEEEAHLCSQYDAEVAELASLGDGAKHAIAGHDLVWQAGGQV